MHVTPLRNYYLTTTNNSWSKLINQFALLTRKVWNTKAFKSHLSPHDLLQEMYSSSKKKLQITKQSDPIEFMSWFLNSLNKSHSTSAPPSSIIHDMFQGTLYY